MGDSEGAQGYHLPESNAHKSCTKVHKCLKYGGKYQGKDGGWLLWELGLGRWGNTSKDEHLFCACRVPGIVHIALYICSQQFYEVGTF